MGWVCNLPFQTAWGVHGLHLAQSCQLSCSDYSGGPENQGLVLLIGRAMLCPGYLCVGFGAGRITGRITVAFHSLGLTTASQCDILWLGSVRSRVPWGT